MTSYRFRAWDAPRARAVKRTPARLTDAFLGAANAGRVRAALARNVPAGPLRDFALAGLAPTMTKFARVRARGVLGADPLAQRAASGSATWARELGRLNKAFVRDRLEFVHSNRRLILTGESDEDYAMAMFTADSLRPRGFERLNDPGPWHEHLEGRRPDRGKAAPRMTPGVAEEDRAWEAGDPDRSAAEAMATYWGEGAVASEAPSRAACQPAKTRAMRYKGIPRWQHTSRPLDGMERDIGRSLGLGDREHGTHVRRWGNTATREYLGFRSGGDPVGHTARGVRKKSQLYSAARLNTISP